MSDWHRHVAPVAQSALPAQRIMRLRRTRAQWFLRRIVSRNAETHTMTRRIEPSAMPCEGVRQRLEQYLDGALSPDEHAAMRSHLSLCQTCHAEAGGIEA